MVVATRFVGLVAAYQDLRAVVVRGFSVDDPLGVRCSLPAACAVGGHPHTAVFGEQSQVRGGAKRFTAEVECEARSNHIIALIQKVFHQLEEPGVAGEELHLVEGDDLEFAAQFGFTGAEDGPEITWVTRGDFFRDVLVAAAAADGIHAAAGIGAGFKDGDFLVPVATQGFNLRQEMPSLARSHVTDEET